MNKLFTKEPDCEDGSNVLVGTRYWEEELQGRVMPWYLPTQSKGSAGWRRSWETMRARMDRLVDECQPVACKMVQTRLPAFGAEREFDRHEYPGILKAGPGLERTACKLHPVREQPLIGQFLIHGANGTPICTAEGQPHAFRFGLSRYFILHTAPKHQGDPRPVPHPQFAELAQDGAALIYQLPAEIAVHIWKNWTSGFSRARSSAELLWLDALFELAWTGQPGSRLFTKRFARMGPHGSCGLIGNGLFPRLPTVFRKPMTESVPDEGGHPTAWFAELPDVARASVAAIDEILELGIGEGSAAQPTLARSTPSLGRATSIKPQTMNTTSRDKVFVSYSHKDKKFLEELLAHLKPLERAGRVSAWSDKQIHPGSQWSGEIQMALNSTKVAVLLVTKDFLASDFIHDQELGPLLKAATTGGVVILWVLVRDCNWRKTPLRDYQAAFSTDKPLAEMKAERDSAWVTICEAIELASNPR